MAFPSHSSLFSSRKQREFTPDSKKDDTYWDRRRRNNAAAKRSREKRRLNDMLLEKRVVQLSRENHILRAQVTAVFKSYGIRAETLVDMDQVMATLPTEDQLLNMTCTPTRYVSIAWKYNANILQQARHKNAILTEFVIDFRSLPSPPPMAATMIALPRPPASPPARPIHSPIPTQHPMEDLYRNLVPGGVAYPRDCPPELPEGPPLKRPALLPPAASNWDEMRTANSGSSTSNISSPSCDSSSNDDPINLTTNKSRSRSSSETEDEMNHMPHKLRYKYHHHHLESNKQTDEDY